MNKYANVAALTCAFFLSSAGGTIGSQGSQLTKDEVNAVWALLDREARLSSDAGFLLYALYGRDGGDTLKQGWDKFGAGCQWLDWWLVLRPLPRRPLHSNNYFPYLYSTEESELLAVEKRPRILGRIVQARLYLLGGVWERLKQVEQDRLANESISICCIKDVWLWWDENADLETYRDSETPSVYGVYESNDRRVRYLPVWVNRLRWCYWLFGRESEVTRVTELTWKNEYLAFRKWLSDNELYLRFDEKEFQFRIDQNAKRESRSVPEIERLIPAPKTPFPDWKGETPDAYDRDLAQGPVPAGTDIELASVANLPPPTRWDTRPPTSTTRPAEGRQ
jgi:hypothetical protein